MTSILHTIEISCKAGAQRQLAPRLFALAALLLLLGGAWTPSVAQPSLTATVGTLFAAQTPDDHNLDFAGSVWYPFDQMVFMGVSSGVQRIGKKTDIPALASLMVRLPIGRQLLTVATGDWGWLFTPDGGQMIWRVGGGLDLKLGDRSSLMAFSGVQNHSEGPMAIYARGGLLLDF